MVRTVPQTLRVSSRQHQTAVAVAVAEQPGRRQLATVHYQLRVDRPIPRPILPLYLRGARRDQSQALRLAYARHLDPSWRKVTRKCA